MKEITVEELKKMMETKEDFQLIDVREPNEYDQANINIALHIPLGNILADNNKISRVKKVILHCRSGKRSATAIQHLEKNFGLTNLYNLKGGILEYAQKFDKNLNVS